MSNKKKQKKVYWPSGNANIIGGEEKNRMPSKKENKMNTKDKATKVKKMNKGRCRKADDVERARRLETEICESSRAENWTTDERQGERRGWEWRGE